MIFFWYLQTSFLMWEFQMINLTISVFIPQHNKDTISRHWNYKLFLISKDSSHQGKMNVGHFSRETVKGNHMWAHEQAWLAFSFEVGLSSRKVGENQLNTVLFARYVFLHYLALDRAVLVGLCFFMFTNTNKLFVVWIVFVCTILLLTSVLLQ